MYNNLIIIIIVNTLNAYIFMVCILQSSHMSKLYLDDFVIFTIFNFVLLLVLYTFIYLDTLMIFQYYKSHFSYLNIILKYFSKYGCCSSVNFEKLQKIIFLSTIALIFDKFIGSDKYSISDKQLFYGYVQVSEKLFLCFSFR